MGNETKLFRPWKPVFERGVACLFCGDSDHTVVMPSSGATSVKEGEDAAGTPTKLTSNRLRAILNDAPYEGEGADDARRGVCEVCAILCRRTWSSEVGERAEGAPAAGSGTSVRVVLPRLTDGCDPRIPQSYEVAVVDAERDFPGASLNKGENVLECAKRALELVGVSTWSLFLERLYEAYTPRGRLATVVLCRAWTCPDESPPKVLWKAWPFWEVYREMSGFYAPLRELWPLLLWKKFGDREVAEGSELSTHLREGAAKYVRIQQRLRAGEKVDTSMSEYLRRAMTSAELAVDAALRAAEEGEAEAAAEEAEAASPKPPAGVDYNPPAEEAETVEAPEASKPAEPTGEGGEDDGGDPEDDGPGDPADDDVQF